MRMTILTIVTLLAGVLLLGEKLYDSKNAADFAAFIQQEDVQIVDVRTAEEIVEGYIDGAVNIDLSQKRFMRMAKSQLNRKFPVAVYCRSGRRSAVAAEKLAKSGYQVVNLDGGFLAWEQAKMPIVRPSAPCCADKH
ncbi:MAG: rhodanese-like domain-containing protein [Prevotella sp.]|nr:rhodanese-like domain-containing protein [Prevotella sp.]